MVSIMKFLKKTAVIVMCLSLLLTLFGCKKPKILDGPGMVMEIWDQFTISQASDDYSQCYVYTVRHDNNWKYYFVAEVFDYELGYLDEKSIELDNDTVNELISLNLLALPDEAESTLDAEILDGTFLNFTVTDVNGKSYKKVISAKDADKIFELIKPYINIAKDSMVEVK